MDISRLTLRKANLDDVPLLTEWLSNPDFAEYVFDVPEETGQLRNKAIALIEKSSSEPSVNVILIARDIKPIGLILMNNIDQKNKNASVSILVGDDSLKNKIYGLSLLYKSLEMAFEEMGLHKITGCTYEHNIKMINVLEHFGAIKEGLMKEYKLRDKKWLNMAIYAFFQRDFNITKSNLKEKGLLPL